MTIECDDNDYESGSSCAFSCPAPFRVNGTDSITCNAGKWDAIAPSCCMGMWIWVIFMNHLCQKWKKWSVWNGESLSNNSLGASNKWIRCFTFAIRLGHFTKFNKNFQFGRFHEQTPPMILLRVSTLTVNAWPLPPFIDQIFIFWILGSGCPRDFKLDLYFVVDASSSIGEDNFALVRKFLKSLAEYFDVGQDTVRIGMISFNRKVTQILKLSGTFSKYGSRPSWSNQPRPTQTNLGLIKIQPLMKNWSDVKNKSDLDDAVDRIPYNGKGTNTGKALREVVRNAFVARNGDRPDVQNQVSTRISLVPIKI